VLVPAIKVSGFSSSDLRADTGGRARIGGQPRS
jgi:hypothetical protein